MGLLVLRGGNLARVRPASLGTLAGCQPAFPWQQQLGQQVLGPARALPRMGQDVGLCRSAEERANTTFICY